MLNLDLQIHESRKSSFTSKVKELFRILFYCYVFLLFTHLFTSLVDFIIELQTNFSFNDLINNLQKKASKNNPVYFFLIISPIFEELIFRLPLKVKRINIFISISLFYSFLYYNFEKLFSLDEILKALGFIIVLYLLIFEVLKDSFYELLAGRYYKPYFYFIAIAFGLLHTTNFIADVPKQLMPFSFLFALNQVISGVFLGYTRIKIGLPWSIVLHFLFNLLPAIAYYI